MKEHIDVLVDALKRGENPLNALAAFVAAWSTVDSSNILSTQIRRRLGLSYMGPLHEAFRNLLARISSDSAFKSKAVEALALAIERDWVRNALKEAAWKGVAQQLKSAVEELQNYRRSYSIRVLLDDIQNIINSQQVRSFYDTGPAPQQQYYGPQPSAPSPGYPQPPPSSPPRYQQAGQPTPASPPYGHSGPQYPPQPAGSQPRGGASLAELKPDIKFEDLLGGGRQPASPPAPAKPAEPTAQSQGVTAGGATGPVISGVEKMLDTVQVRLSKLADEVRKVGEAVEVLSAFRKWFEDRVKEFSSSLNEIKSEMATLKGEISDIKATINALKKDVDELKKQRVAVKTTTSAEEKPPAELKAAIEEIFQIIDDVRDVSGEDKSAAGTLPAPSMQEIKPPAPKTGVMKLQIDKIIEEEVKKIAASAPQEAEKKVYIPSYVYLMAIGNLAKLRKMLKDYEEPGVESRWKLVIPYGSKQIFVYVQALHGKIPTMVFSEALKLADGILVLTPIRDVAKLNNVLARLIQSAKKCKFVVFDSKNPGRGIVIPRNVKSLMKNIKSSEDIKKVVIEDIIPALAG